MSNHRTTSPTAILLLAAFAAAAAPEAGEYHDCPPVLTYRTLEDELRMFSCDSEEAASVEEVLASLGECIDNGEMPRFAPGQAIELRRAVAWDGSGGIASTAPWTSFPAPGEPALV